MKKLILGLAVLAVVAGSRRASAAKPASGGGGFAPALVGYTGRISYTCGTKICVYNLATSTNFDTSVSGINSKFSADGSRIVYQSGGVWAMNPDGTNKVQINTDGAVPSWSPDGLQVAFHTSAGVFKQNADGTGRVQLATHGRSAAWSPSGAQIVFSSLQGSSDYDLWIMNSDGSSAAKVLIKAGSDIDVVWQSGSQIVFANQSDKDIWKFDPTTTALTRLTTYSGNDFEGGWEPGAGHVVFYSARSPAGIYVMNADGTAQLSAGFSGRQPSWGP